MNIWCEKLKNYKTPGFFIILIGGFFGFFVVEFLRANPVFHPSSVIKESRINDCEKTLYKLMLIYYNFNPQCNAG